MGRRGSIPPDGRPDNGWLICHIRKCPRCGGRCRYRHPPGQRGRYGPTIPSPSPLSSPSTSSPTIF